MPQVEVNEENIDRFALVELTGNTREEMLSMAADAAVKGYVFSVKVPDELLHMNIFDAAVEVETPVTDGLVHNDRCRYEKRIKKTKYREDEAVYFCIIHNQETNGDPDEDPQTPCLGAARP